MGKVNPHVPGNYVNVFLTDAEMAQFDAQDYYEPGDEVAIGGYVPEHGENNGIDISVNEEMSDSASTRPTSPARRAICG